MTPDFLYWYYKTSGVTFLEIELHYYKRNLGDYAKKCGRLTMLQHGAYTLLIDSCYDREVFPTLEQAIEWTWASTEAEIEAVKFVLSRFFTLGEDGQYVQDRILQELLEYHAKADTNKRIAIERETKRKQQSTNREQGVNEPPPNHKPLTNNHKPLTNSVAKATGDKSPISTDEIIFSYGVPLLTNAGIADKQARSFLGGLRKSHGDDALVDALRECLKAKPLQPLEWLAAVLPPKGASKKPQQQSFAERDELAKRKKWEEMTGRQWPSDERLTIDVTPTFLEIEQ